MRIFTSDDDADDRAEPDENRGKSFVDLREPYIIAMERLYPEIWDCWDEADFHPTKSPQPLGLVLLWAANYAHCDICNGGFHQFFGNSTGRVAPEAARGFELLGLAEGSAVIKKAMQFFGQPYTRSDMERKQFLDAVPGAYDRPREFWDPFIELDEEFYDLIERPHDRFNAIANQYVQAFP